MKTMQEYKREKYAKLSRPVVLDEAVFRGSLYQPTVEPDLIPLADMDLPIGVPGARAMRKKILAARLKRDAEDRLSKGLPAVLPNGKPMREKKRRQLKVIHPVVCVKPSCREAAELLSDRDFSAGKPTIRKRVPVKPDPKPKSTLDRSKRPQLTQKQRIAILEELRSRKATV